MEENEEIKEQKREKFSSLNTMFIASTLSKPNIESIINAVATILHSKMF